MTLKKSTFITDTENYVYDLTSLAAYPDDYRTSQSFVTHFLPMTCCRNLWLPPWRCASADGFNQFKEMVFWMAPQVAYLWVVFLKMGGLAWGMWVTCCTCGATCHLRCFYCSTGLLLRPQSHCSNSHCWSKEKQQFKQQELVLSNSSIESSSLKAYSLILLCNVDNFLKSHCSCDLEIHHTPGYTKKGDWHWWHCI